MPISDLDICHLLLVFPGDDVQLVSECSARFSSLYFARKHHPSGVPSVYDTWLARGEAFRFSFVILFQDELVAVSEEEAYVEKLGQALKEAEVLSSSSK